MRRSMYLRTAQYRTLMVHKDLVRAAGLPIYSRMANLERSLNIYRGRDLRGFKYRTTDKFRDLKDENPDWRGNRSRDFHEWLIDTEKGLWLNYIVNEELLELRDRSRCRRRR